LIPARVRDRGKVTRMGQGVRPRWPEQVDGRIRFIHPPAYNPPNESIDVQRRGLAFQGALLVERVHKLLEDNGVPHWMGPRMVVINLSQKADPRRARELLDAS
jgi:hypothetical protein